MIHILFAFLSYACFGVSFTASILYLIQYRQLKKKQAGRFYHKLPSLEELEHLIAWPILLGTPMLGTALVLGSLWAKEMLGNYALADLKTLLTAAVLVGYSVLFYFRFQKSLKTKQLSLLSLLLFLIVVAAFIGVRFIPGTHY